MMQEGQPGQPEFIFMKSRFFQMSDQPFILRLALLSGGRPEFFFGLNPIPRNRVTAL
jgi:hypothetical protein